MVNKDRTKVHRSPAKQVFDPEVVRAITARAVLAYVAIVEDGQPFCIPVVCAPYKGELLLHGSSASRLFNALAAGTPACVTITHLQALVLARSAFDSSMRYQSLMALGSARPLHDQEKSEALNALTDHLFPERRHQLRPTTKQEMQATSILAFPLTEVSIKVSSTIPEDPDPILDAGVWVGILPITATYGPPIPVDDLDPGIHSPEYISRWPINRI